MGKKGLGFHLQIRLLLLYLAKTDPFAVLRFLFRRGAILISMGYRDRFKTFTFFFGTCLAVR